MLGVDLMSNRNTNTPMSRSCLTSLHCELKGIEELKLKSLCGRSTLINHRAFELFQLCQTQVLRQLRPHIQRDTKTRQFLC